MVEVLAFVKEPLAELAGNISNTDDDAEEEIHG